MTRKLFSSHGFSLKRRHDHSHFVFLYFCHRERKKQPHDPEQQTVDEPSVGNEWSESGSEMTSVISGSSVWTDSSNANERSSRRALILQMAKARMKQNKNPSHTEDKTYVAIVEESSVQSSNRDTSRMEANVSECGEDMELD